MSALRYKMHINTAAPIVSLVHSFAENKSSDASEIIYRLHYLCKNTAFTSDSDLYTFNRGQHGNKQTHYTTPNTEMLIHVFKQIIK